jgi:hypothetical protein
LAGGLADAVTEIYVFREEPVAEPPLEERLSPDTALPEQDPAIPVTMSSLSGARRLSAAGGAMYAAVGQVDPSQPQPAPEDEEAARRELIEAIAPADIQPIDAQPLDSQPADEPLPPQPRWVFLNGKWIEVQPEPAPPQVQPIDTMPTARQQVAEFPALPQPTIDWGEIAGETQTRIIRVSAEALRNGDPRQNIIIRARDTVRLSAGQSGEYYMMGQINRPGAYSLTGRKLTLKEAVAAAGNLSALAWPERCTIYRRLGDREEMIQINLDRIFAGQDPDFFLKKDDLVMVGTHPASLFLAVIRSAFRLTYGFGFVYDRNFADVDLIRRQIEASADAQARVQAANRFQGLFP